MACGAAPVSAELTRQVAQVLKNSWVAQGYGMTEAGSITRFFPESGSRIGTLGSVGRLIPGTACRVLKADGTWGGYNETGHLIITSPGLALGYLNNPEATAETFKDGWLYTGDEGYVNEKKEIFILDRIKVRLVLLGRPRDHTMLTVVPMYIVGAH